MLRRCRTMVVVLLKEEEFNFSLFVNRESRTVNRLHINPLCNRGCTFLGKRTIPRDNMASIKEEKLLSMVFSFARNKKLNTHTVYWKDNLEICLRKLRVLRV